MKIKKHSKFILQSKLLKNEARHHSKKNFDIAHNASVAQKIRKVNTNLPGI